MTRIVDENNETVVKFSLPPSVTDIGKNSRSGCDIWVVVNLLDNILSHIKSYVTDYMSPKITQSSVTTALELTESLKI